MKKRSTELLQRLLDGQNTVLYLSKLQEEYHISEKTLRNDIQEMADFLDDAKLPDALSVNSRSVSLSGAYGLREIRSLISNMDLYDYKLSLDERKQYIIITLLYNDGYYSMQQLADEMYVTRNTIVNDCKIVEEFLQDYDVSYTARSKKGVRIICDPMQRSDLLVDIFCAIIPSMSYERGFFAQFIVRKLGFSHQLREIIFHMNQYTRQNNIIFGGEVFFEIALCLFVLLNTMEDRQRSSDPLELDILGDMISYVAREMGFAIGDSDVVSIEQAILQRDLKPEIQSINDFELYGVISHFLLEVGREINIDIQNDDLLVKALLAHIKDMKNWGGVEFDINDEYAEIGLISNVHQSVEDKFYILENYLRYQMDENMKASIIIHICAALYRHQENSAPCNVIVSCPGSMATSKYLEAQVRKYFNLAIVGTMTTKQVMRQQDEMAGVDFIISTVNIPDCTIPVVVVSPLLTVEDINKIQNVAFKKHRQEIPTKVEGFPLLERLLMVYSTGDRKKIAYLDRELKRVLEEVFRIESEAAKKSALMQMLQLKYVKVLEGPLEWRDAMKMASKDLIRDGYFDNSYLQKAIENVEEYGSYIIVNQGIALAHANRDAGVYKDGIGLLVARDGITFEDGETVYLMFFFSQKGETDYLDLFKEIIKLGNDANNVKKMRQMERSGDVYQLIVEILTDYDLLKEE